MIHPKTDPELRTKFIDSLDVLKTKHSLRGNAAHYLDESEFKSHDHRPSGYAPKGFVCLGQYNWQLKNQTNAIGAVHHNQLFTVGLFDCKINSDVFHFWVERFLIPELPKNSVVIMDNATFYKRSDTQE